ncbi:glycosyltransferase family 2 protein [Methylobacter sp. sgz302048]|uniref:glycosyltransferase family 2 protein n=1 Tax=Methylobacter sp. sgz302048 TaxID=3455945 RepID=UPI003FA16F70
MSQIQDKKVLLTIFTPAYNRANLLPRVFDSICSQVHPDDPIEWLVIDDGSTDNTEAVLAEFADKRPDLIRFILVKNGGKHRAINLAAERANGDWVMIVDSDDYLVNGSINQVLETIRLVNSDPRIGLVRALRQFPELGIEYSFEMPTNPCSHAEWLLSQHPIDTAEVIRRTALQMHPFPDIPGERFMAESWLWYHLDRTHLTLFINSPWIECFYQPEGLSASSRRIRASSPCSAMEVYAAMLESILPWRLRVRASINWWRYRYHANNQHKIAVSEFRASHVFALPGWLMFLHDRFLIQC